MKIPKLFFIFVFTFFPLFYLCAITEYTGAACPEYKCFAVDGEENIYLGQNHAIVVFDAQGSEITRFDPPTNRGYKFTYLEPYGLVISTSYNYSVVDKTGNTSLKIPVTDDNRDLAYGISSRKFISADGRKYIMRDRFLRPCVFRVDGGEQTEIYRMPLNDYIIRLLKAFNLVYAAVSIPVIIFQWQKAEKEVTYERAYSHRRR